MSFTLKVNTSRLEERLRRYAGALRETMETELTAIAEQAVTEVAARTPPPEVEYEYLMIGSGTSGAKKLVPLAGNRSDDRDSVRSGAERIRFIRAPGMWLKDLVVSPTTYSVDPATLTIRLGIVPALEAGSHFSWQNRDRAGNEYTHTSEYGVWSLFEYGGPHEVSPRGIGYRLRPDDDTHHLDQPYSMIKDYPRFGFYTGLNKTTFIEAVKARIRDVKY